MLEFNFEKLEIWQESMELVEKIYALTEKFPSNEQFGITNQLRRAAVSIPLNIAEGKGRYHNKEFLQFLYIARGSLYETTTLLKLSYRLSYLDKEQLDVTLDSYLAILRKLSGLVSSIKSNSGLGSEPRTQDPEPIRPRGEYHEENFS